MADAGRAERQPRARAVPRMGDRLLAVLADHHRGGGRRVVGPRRRAHAQLAANKGEVMTLGHTSSLCAVCKQGIPAELVETEGRVVMRKRCPRHGRQDVLIASDAAWYHRTLAFGAVLKPPRAKKPVSTGCPYDCGACTSH